MGMLRWNFSIQMPTATSGQKSLETQEAPETVFRHLATVLDEYHPFYCPESVEYSGGMGAAEVKKGAEKNS